MTNKTALERFEDKVELIPFSTCHWWVGNVDPSGYGQQMVRVNAAWVVAPVENTSGGVKMKDLAKMFGLSTVQHIVRYKTWRHVA